MKDVDFAVLVLTANESSYTSFKNVLLITLYLFVYT